MPQKTDSVNRTCQLSDVDRRLEDAAALWRRANDSYFSPDDFRIAVQPCIQTFRSITWVLQNNKDQIKDFDTWYTGWQEKMKADLVLRWLVEARNKIEKQGDLQTNSKLRVTLSNSWNDKPLIECELSPLTAADEIADQVAAMLPDQIWSEEAILKIERLWVEDHLPDYEILGALAHCYHFLFELIRDAHRHLASFSVQPICNASVDQAILECSVNVQKPRLVWIKLRNGEQAIITPFSVKVTDESLEEARKRYQMDALVHGLSKSASFREQCLGWFQIAKHMLQVDKRHLPVALLQTEKTIHMIGLRMDDRAEKHIAIRNLAQQAKRLNAHTLFLINEVWVSPAQKVSENLYRADAGDRGEGIVLHGLTRKGEFLTCSASFQRIGGVVVLDDDDQIDSEIFPNILIPFCDVWKIKPFKH